MDELIFSLNTVLPLVLLVLLGYVLKRIALIPDPFYPAAEKFVFKIALPCSLFLSVSRADPHTAFSPSLILFCVVGTLISIILLMAAVPFFVRDNARRGAFIQGVYRSNFALLGTPLAQRLFPETGGTVAASLMPFTIPLYNVVAVSVLSFFAPTDKKQTPIGILKKTVIGIVTNPLIIGIVLALPLMLTQAKLPSIATGTLQYIGGTASPLALICIGASMYTRKGETDKETTEKGVFALAVTASFLKTVVLPLAAVSVAALMGFRDVQLGLILITFGSPTAVSSYIMAKNMGSNHKLAGQILLISTVLCAFTLFLGIYILTSLSLIAI